MDSRIWELDRTDCIFFFPLFFFPLFFSFFPKTACGCGVCLLAGRFLASLSRWLCVRVSCGAPSRWCFFFFSWYGWTSQWRNGSSLVSLPLAPTHSLYVFSVEPALVTMRDGAGDSGGKYCCCCSCWCCRTPGLSAMGGVVRSWQCGGFPAGISLMDAVWRQREGREDEL